MSGTFRWRGVDRGDASTDSVGVVVVSSVDDEGDVCAGASSVGVVVVSSVDEGDVCSAAVSSVGVVVVSSVDNRVDGDAYYVVD